MRWVLPSVLLVSSLLACSIGTPTPPAPVADVPTATLPAAAPPTEQPPAPVSVATAPPPPTTPPISEPTNAVEGPGRSPTPPPADQPPPPPTPTPTIPGLWLEDRFENPDNDGNFDRGLWHLFDDSTTVEQKDGILMLSRQSPSSGGLYYGPLKIGELGFVEAKVMLDSNIEASLANVGIQIYSNSHDLWFECVIEGGQRNSNALAKCQTDDGYGTNGVIVPYNSWHTVRFEINPTTAVLSFFVDGQPIGTYTSPNPEAFKQAQVNVALRVWSEDGGLVTGYIDDVRVGKAQAEESEVDPALYDCFCDPAYEGTFDPEKWAVGGPPTQVGQQNGKMVFTLTQPNPGDGLELHPIQPEFWKLDQFDFIEAKLNLSSETITTSGGSGNLSLGLQAPLENNRELSIGCGIERQEPLRVNCAAYVWDKTNQKAEDYVEIGSIPTNFDREHIVRIEVNPEANITFYIDGEKLGSYRPTQADVVKNGLFRSQIWIYSETQDSIKGYADDVRIGRLGQ